MDCPAPPKYGIYRLSRDYRVTFTAHAPLHRLNGRTDKGIDAVMEIDFQGQAITQARAVAQTAYFETTDLARKHAMADYIRADSFPHASVQLIRCIEFIPLGPSHFRASVLAVLEFMGRQRQIPLSFTLAVTPGGLDVDLALKWSFRTYGLKPPSLLFLKFRDIVDVHGKGRFDLAANQDPGHRPERP